jgi:hypothetical protein
MPGVDMAPVHESDISAAAATEATGPPVRRGANNLKGRVFSHVRVRAVDQATSASTSGFTCRQQARGK